MGKKIGELILDLGEKLGYDTTDPIFKDLLTLTTEVPKPLADAIDQQLYTEQAAIANRTIKTKLIEPFAQQNDEVLSTGLAAAGFTKERIDEIFAENKGYTQRAKAALKEMSTKIKDAAENKQAPTEDKAKDEKIRALNEELATFKETYVPKTELESTVQKYESEIENSLFAAQIGSLNWSENFDPSIREVAAKAALQAKLDEMGAAMVKDGKSFKLVQKENKVSEYFDTSNKRVTFEEVLNKVAIEKKFLAVSGSSQTAEPVFKTVTGSAVAEGSKKDQRTIDAFDKALADQNVKI